MKRILSVFLAILIVSASTAVSAYSTKDFLNGDVDMSGTVDIRDASQIQRQIAELIHMYPEQKVLADADSDGKINIMDVTKIQKVLVDSEKISEDTKEVTYEMENKVNIYFINQYNWGSVYFYLYNSKTNEQDAAWPGKKITDYELNNSKQKVFYSEVDTDKYNRIIFNNGSNIQTVNVPVTKASSGFKISNTSNSKGMQVTPFAYHNSNKGKTIKTTLPYSAGYQKKIWIWTPGDYNPDAKDKYKTIYMTDGQNLFADHTDRCGGWQIPDNIESMMSNGGRGVIVVGIDNGNMSNGTSKRDAELTPDLGPVANTDYGPFNVRTGEEYSDFVVNKVMPYVQANFNSSTEACDNIIAGSSSGGLEAFYIGMEHMDKFGGIGALSPAFILFSSSTWDSYLSKFDLASENMPRLYIFNGKNEYDQLEKDLCEGAVAMNTKLLSKGYDENKIILEIEDTFTHSEHAWRIIFPDMVDWIMGL